MREPAQENKKAPNLGGRPRVRSGDEVQVTVEFPLRDYARLAGYVECRKLEAIRRKGSVANQSKRKILLALWQAHWEAIPEALKREIEESERFQREMHRRKRA